MSVLARFQAHVSNFDWQYGVARQVARLVARRPWSASELLRERVRSAPNQLALAYQERRYTFAELERRVNQYARFFQTRDVRASDVVALLMDNRPELVFALLGLNRLRATASLINTNLGGASLSHALRTCAACAVLVGEEHIAALSEVRGTLEPSLQNRLWVEGAQETANTLPEGFESITANLTKQPDGPLSGLTRASIQDVMCYIYTSGTTGLPKAAIVKNRRFLTMSVAFAGALMGATERDVIYVTLPLYHASALCAGLGGSLVSGAALALRRKFSASDFWRDVHGFDATIIVYIGELGRYLLNTAPHPLERRHRVRVAVGNGMRPDIWQAFQERFAVPQIREFYGSTEGNAGLANFAGKPGMIGRLRMGQVIVRCDESTGELCRDARGFCQRVSPGEKGILLAHINPLLSFDGYLDRRATEKKVVPNVFRSGDRYFDTGDLVQLHESRWVSFADRVGDSFRWKGENVSTNEVAESLNRVAGVLESNVYGVEVVNNEGRAGMASLNIGAEFDLEAFTRHVLNELPSYQRPLFLRLQKGMNITATFKHQKATYRAEGYDPNKVVDPLYVLDGDKYAPLNTTARERQVGDSDRQA